MILVTLLGMPASLFFSKAILSTPPSKTAISVIHFGFPVSHPPFLDTEIPEERLESRSHFGQRGCPWLLDSTS